MTIVRTLLVSGSLLGAAAATADFESPAAGPAVSPEPARSKPWDLVLRGSVGHNDNVQLVPDTSFYPAEGRTSASYFSLQGNGAYRFYRSGPLVTGATLSFSSLWHENRKQTADWSFSDYNFYSLNPGLFASYEFRLGGRPATLTASYDYAREDGHNEELHALGLTSHNLGILGSVQLSGRMTMTALLAYGSDEFEVEFPDPALDDRDANRFSLDLGVRYWLSGGRHNLSAGVGYVNNNANGRNFDYDGYNLRLRYENAFLRPVWLAGEIKYGDRDYRGFTSFFIPPPGRENQKITSASLQALWPIDRHWSADVFYRHEQYDSNQPEFEADANVFGAGLSYRF